MKTYNQLTKSYFKPMRNTRLEKLVHSCRFLTDSTDEYYLYYPYYDEVNNVPVYYYVCDGRDA